MCIRDRPVLIDGKFSSWNSTSADGIFDDGAAIGLFAVEGAFTADAPRYICLLYTSRCV